MPIRSKLPWVEIPSVPFYDYFFSEIRRYGSTTALINYETKEQFTFEEIIAKAEQTANALMALGVEKGEAVLLCVENCPEFVWLFMGITLAGAAPSTLSPKFSAGEMRLQIMDSEARFAFVAPQALDSVSTVFVELERPHRIICTGARREAQGFPILADLSYMLPCSSNAFPKIDPEEDIAYLPFSSGMNGNKKGIRVTHKAMNAKISTSNNPRCYIQPLAGECTVTLMPFSKQIGMDALFNALFNGATVVTVSKMCVHQLMEALEFHKVKTVVLNPLMLRLMCNEEERSEGKLNLRSLETVVVGTAPTTKELVDLAKRTFPTLKNILPVYGMTEVGLISRTMPNFSPRHGSCGILAANIELKIVDIFSGEELGANRTGLIFLAGPSANAPYWNNDEANQEHFVKGWRNTGDIGYYDEDENLFLVDKTKEMIKVHGYQVIPTEIEKILTSHPSVAEAAVVSVVDESAGERPFAFVVLQNGRAVSTEELLAFTNSRIVRYKQLVAVVVAQMLPKSPCGRVLRRLLAEAAALNITSS